MFAKATRNFLKDTDPGGDLIPVSSLNDSDRLQLLSLVVKKKKFWFWQRPKYQFLSATINDILSKDQFVNPVVVESDFVKYEGKFEDVVKGTIETALGRITLNVGGSGLVESQSSFGSLRKQEVDLQQLIREAVDKKINLKSPLLQQILERKNEVLCILIQKIVTTQKCVISEHVQIEEKCGGMVGLKTKRVKVSVSEDGNVIRDSNVVLEIPGSTPIAYRVLELFIKQDGQFGMLLLERNFRPFVELSGHHQAALCEILWEILFNDELVVALDTVLDDIVTGGSPKLTTLRELSPLQQRQLATFLGLAGLQVQKDLLVWRDTQSNQELLSIIHFFISALADAEALSIRCFSDTVMLKYKLNSGEDKFHLLQEAVPYYVDISDFEEMPDNTPALMGTCCKLRVVPALCHLPQVTSPDGFSDLGDPSLAPLNDTERFEIVQKLFALSNISLERREATVKASIMKKPQYLPLILYIILSGLCALERKDE